MGQKVNPTCLRLHPKNKHFDSCWFSEKQYSHSIQKDLHIEIYYNAILKQIQYPSASFFFEGSPRKCGVSVLFLNPSQFREQIFKQFGNVKGRNRRVKQNTLFSAKKKNTSLYGLPEKKEELLGLLPPYFFTNPFLQNLKERENVPFLQERKKKENQNLRFSKSLSGTEKRSDASLFSHIVERGVKVADRQTELRLKRSLCFSVIGLAISRYFTERDFNENLLSSTSRFLLLQAFFCFLSKGKGGRFSSQRLEDLSHISQEKRNSGGGQRGQPVMSNMVNNSHVLLSQPLPSLTRDRLPPFYLSRQIDARASLFPHLQKSSIYNYHIESIISSQLRSSCKIFLFKAQNVAQNALFIAEEIVYQLQRRNTFRQIKTKFLQELGNKSTIKGVRVTCVGRIGGRAKKAQRARGESFKTGQTSLHLFDSKVSFASKTALTPYGAVGVKVWVCWK